MKMYSNAIQLSFQAVHSPEMKSATRAAPQGASAFEAKMARREFSRASVFPSEY